VSATPAQQSASPSAQSEPAPPRVLFLGGLGRSGTTVLERVVGELPGVCAAGELVHLWQRGVLDDDRCGCGEPFSRCSFWTAVGDIAFGGWTPERASRMVHLRSRVDRSRFIPVLARPRLLGRRRAELDEYTAAFERLYQAIAEVSGAAAVVDSSKHPSLAYCLRTGAVDLRVVHVVRDIRGVAYSWTKKVRRPEVSAGDDLMPRFSPTRSAALWFGHNLSLSLLPRLGTATRLVRYEDFVADPRAALEDLSDFASIRVPPDSLPFGDGDSVMLHASHTVAGNPMRFTVGPLTLRRDDDWRDHLPRGPRWLVTLLTLPMLARYGYLGRPKGNGTR
jgi:hypothetical protein